MNYFMLKPGIILLISLTLSNNMFAQKTLLIGSELKFETPENWQVSSDPNRRVDIVIKKKQSGLTENITLRIIGEVLDSDIYANREMFISPMRARYPNLSIQKVERIQLIENENDLLFEVRIPNSPNLDAWTSQVFFIHKNNAYYTSINGRINQIAELKSVFNEFLNSFEPQ